MRFLDKYPSVRAFISYTGRFKGAFWLTAATFAVSDVIITLVPWLIGRLTDSLTQAGGNITAWTAALIIASIGHDVLWRCGEIMYMKLLLDRTQRIDDGVFEAVMHKDYAYFVDKFTGKISSYANSLGREYREMMDNFHYQYVNLVVAMPIIAATMFSVNSYTGALFVIALILMFVVGRHLARAAADSERVEADERSSTDGLTVDAIANFVSVKAFASEKREASRLFNRRQALMKAARHSYFRSILFWGAMSLFVRWIIWPATFILNVHLYRTGQISLADITTFLTVIVLFSSFIWEVIWNISQLNIKLARIDEAYRYLFGTANIFSSRQPVPPAPSRAKTFRHSLELDRIGFAYPDKPDAKVLDGVSLKIRRGEKIGLVGPSGGGKSTFLKLLLGYYPLTRGKLLLDGNKVDNQALTELISYVPQDTAVFHRSIKENIAYARPDATEAEIIAAAKHAYADHFIQELANGYDTLVGERGVKLSGGQRQRIAIARAILKDAPLLLLDEATSALDSESEKQIQSALQQLLETRTAIVIAHRLSTIQHMDRIIVFDGGRIVETGNHATLLAQKGLYARLWAHQTDGFIQE